MSPARASDVTFVIGQDRYHAGVEVDSVFESVVLAIVQQRHYAPKLRDVVIDPRTVFTITYDGPVTVHVRLATVLRWLHQRRGLTPDQQERRQWLRNVLAERDRV